jgi:hypothetical protein
VATTTLVAKAQAALEAELHRFVAGDLDRSVAVRVLDGPPLCAEVAADVVRPAASFLKLLPALALYDAAERGASMRTTLRRLGPVAASVRSKEAAAEHHVCLTRKHRGDTTSPSLASASSRQAMDARGARTTHSGR